MSPGERGLGLRVHHVFVAVEPATPAIALLGQAGFALAAAREHEGQGTANRCLHLANGYLELLWARDAAELASDTVRPTGLAERLDWRRSGASPFGVALKAVGGASVATPFPVVPYRAPFAGGRFTLLLADEPAAKGMPLVFVLPPGLPERTDAVEHPCGASAIARIGLSVPRHPSASPALAWLVGAGLCEARQTPEPAMTLDLAGGDGRHVLDLAPHAPVRLAW